MTREEAIRILDPQTAVDTLAEIEYYHGFQGVEAVSKALDDACILAVEAIREQKERRWIPVTERFPDYSVPSTFYLCYWNGYIRVCKYWRTRNVFELRGKEVKVTHWMPLPEPPKEDK